MPPKQGPSKKTTEKVKAKIVEDKTFGLKNKKGAKQQKFIQTVQKQVQNKGVPNNRNAIDPNLEREKKKEEEKKKKEELTQLFKPVVQTVSKGVDPKSVVCVYYKQGLCQKGDKCKFSHDLAVERKSEKRNIYEDVRPNDTMENWDQKELEDVVNQKHGEDNTKKNQTQIVCKYFIEAVENKTYGWFWSCPNGEKCMYRHALPPGFVLKSEAKKKDQDDEISLEMLVEKERASLGAGTTKVTLDSFLAWKARKLLEKKEDIKRKEEKKRSDFKLGFMNGLTGRDLFTFNPDLIANDDDNADNDIDYRQRADEDTENAQINEINSEFFSKQSKLIEGPGTVAAADRFAYLESMLEEEKEKNKLKKQMQEAASACAVVEDLENDDEGEQDENGEEEEEEDNEQDDDDLTEEEHKKSLKKVIDNTNKNQKIEIDESLFNLEDLAEIVDEMEELDI